MLCARSIGLLFNAIFLILLAAAIPIWRRARQHAAPDKRVRVPAGSDGAEDRKNAVDMRGLRGGPRRRIKR